MIVQLCGCISDGDDVTPFISNEDADFYAIYIGEPGVFMWRADFAHYEDAFTYATALSKVNGCPLQDTTFSEGASNGTRH